MQRVSSNITLFLKLFIPTMWGVFFGTLAVSLFIVSEDTLPFLTSNYFRLPYLLFYLVFMFILYMTVIQLKRVEMGPEYYYATNYFKTFKLVYDDIDIVDTLHLGGIIWVTFKLKAKGSFGNKITFLASKQLYNLVMTNHPALKELLDAKNA
jgi:hypothetical protein